MKTEKMLKLRKEMNKRKPDFKIKESKFSARVESKWRFPRGKHSKTRQMHCGRQAMPGRGYGSPRSVRGLSSEGLEKVVISTVKELLSLDPAQQGAVISSTLGNRKKLEILRVAEEKKIKLLNVKDSAKLISKIKEGLVTRKKLRSDKINAKKSKEQEKKKKVEEKKEKEAQEKLEKEKKEKNEGKEVAGTIAENKIKAEREKQKETIEKTIIKKQ